MVLEKNGRMCSACSTWIGDIGGIDRCEIIHGEKGSKQAPRIAGDYVAPAA